VSRMSRLVNMGDLKIKSQQSQTLSNTISVGATATTYVYVDTPMPAAGPPGAKRPGPAGAAR
jgi:Tfp pilus assembly protein PilO